MEGEGAGPIRVRRARKRARAPSSGPLQGKPTPNGGMRWFRRSKFGKKRSGNEAEETIAMSEGGLSGDDKDDDDSPRHVPELKYTRGRLMELRSHPLANKRPACLDNPNNEAIAGHGDRKRSETPTEEDSRRRGDSTGNAEKRRSNDPRERVKKEQDGIVLSPQRRSFTTGCYVPPSQSGGSGRRPESPIGKPERMTDRLMRRPDREDRDGREDRGRRDDRDRRDDRRDDRYGRRRHDSREEEPEWFSAGPTSQHDTIELRGFEDIPEDGQVTGRGKKNARTKANSRVAPAARKNSDSSISSGRTASTPPPQEGLKKSSPDGKGSKSDKSRAGGPLATSSPDTKEKRAKQNKTVSENDSKDQKDRMDVTEGSSAQIENGRPDTAEKAGNAQPTSAHMEFNLDDFLKIDTLPSILNGGQAEASGGGSRFSQWFSRNSPTNESMKTVPDDLTNITEPTISIPSGNDLDSYFAPISPAASSLHQKQQLQLHLQQQQLQAKLSQQNAPNKLLEMLRRGSDAQVHPAPAEIPSIRDLEASGKIHSVEELEARMRPKPEGGAMPPMREPRLADPAIASVVHRGGLQQHKEDEAAALKKLIMKRNPEPQVGSDAPGSANNAIMNSFAGMQQAALGSMGPASHGAQLHSQSQSSQPYIPEELLMKLLQVQQQQQQHPHHQQQQHQQQQHQLQQQQRQHPDMLTKLMNNARMSQQHMHQPHQMQQQGNRRGGQMLQSDHYNSIHSSNRSPLPPEVQNLIASTPLNHDLLQRAEGQAILRGLAQREITVQNLVQQLQNPAITRRHQELLLSILKTQSGQRVPSPRDMSLQTQHIMQTALIKKKLEEQKEQQALRKRQENHRSISPNIGNFNNSSMSKNDVKHPMSSPTPLAFTPTSVLKKMNAEKDGDQKIGRPILKSNNNFYSGNDSFPSQPSGGSQNHLQQMQGMPNYLRGPPPSQPQYNARSKMTLSTPPPNMSQQTQQYNMNMMQARPGMPPSNQRGQHLQSMHSGMQNQQHNTSPLQQMLMGAHYSNQKSAMSHGGSGDVSSNSNQLARWFSPEVLAQAKSGPSIPAQGMLSVEEIERLQQAVPN